MKRHSCERRRDWRDKVEAVGLTYHSHDNGPYWDESACYELDAEEIAALENAGNTLHRLCTQAAEAIVRRGWWGRLGIPESAIPTVLHSWDRDDFSLFGRFDLSFDGSGAPKLLEYNADTPTALIEAAVVQWFWLQEMHPNEDQFNSIHERLIEAWRHWHGKTVHFSSIKNHDEDQQTVLYLRDTCEQADVQTIPVCIEDIGWDLKSERFVDLDGASIERCFKLYPWEWLWNEEFGAHLGKEQVQFIEPAWKMLLSNKGLLSVLWELFPEHDNLLAAYDSKTPLAGNYVQKPKLSREGSNVSWVESGRVLEETAGDYGEEGYVYQEIAPMPVFDGNRPVFGVWIVNHEAAGLGIREDTSRITGNLSRFVPHFFTRTSVKGKEL